MKAFVESFCLRNFFDFVIAYYDSINGSELNLDLFFYKKNHN